MNYQIQATFRNIVFNSRDVLGNNPKDSGKTLWKLGGHGDCGEVEQTEKRTFGVRWAS